MNKHQKLDSILKYMSENIGEIPQRPDTIVRKGNLNIEKSESYSMLSMLCLDGYVSSSDKSNTYSILYKGIIFLDNGGSTLQHKIYKRKI